MLIFSILEVRMEENLYYPVVDRGYIRVRTVNGKILPHYLLKNRYSEKFSGYRLIEKDLINIKEALEELIKIKYDANKIIAQSLSFMVIITYGKCFANAEGRKVKLEKESALKDLTAEELKIHNELIQLRNQYVAHGGISKFETNPVAITRMSLEDGSFGYMAHDSCVYMSAINLNAALITVFLAKIIAYVDTKIDKSFTDLMNFVTKEMLEQEFDNNSFIPDYRKLITLKNIESD